MVTLPTFFIAGAPKAGTDLLYYQLYQHPEIYMSPLKEPNFFADEIRPENFDSSLQAHVEKTIEETRKYIEAGARIRRFGGIVSSLPDYEELFAAANSELAIGEGSVCYLWSRSAAAAITKLIPRARIILILMDPAERAFHQYLKSLADGDVTHSFATHLDLAFEDRANPPTQIRLLNPFLSFGEYADQVDRYLKCFSRDQLFLSLYEDLKPNYAGWFSKVLEFLEVRADFNPAAVQVPSTPQFGDRIAPKLQPEERARLVNFYRDDILRLQDQIGRDLRAWLH